MSDAAGHGTVAVYPLVPTRSFDDPLTYLVPDSLDVSVGAVVEIQVGPARRVGIVAEVGIAPPPGIKLRPIGRVIEWARVPPELVELGLWVADQYGCARTRGLALVVSPRLAAHARAAGVPRRTRRLEIRRLDEAPPSALASMSGRLQAVCAQIPTEWTAVGRVTDHLGTTRQSLQRLADAGAVEIEQRVIADDAVDRIDGVDRVGSGSGIEAGLVQLSEEQLAAVDACDSTTPDDPASLLVGITGSGKTEVYLEIIERHLRAGEGAIVLVPEIALTPQTARRFLQRFPDMVEVLHSQMTRVQRADAWDRISRGDKPLVVGPRSAIFAPIPRLGVIVIDEEHDGSYKQDSEPRYDARRVAYRRAKLAGTVLVLGSATPRPESWHGVRRHVPMLHRASGGVLAPVELVDLRQDSDDFPFTQTLTAALDATLRRGRKAIVLHNRRGYATALQCHGCGHAFRCPLCDVSLVVHGSSARAQQLACHHCGHRERVPDTCPECRASDISRMGAGTQRLEKDLEEHFGVPIVRLDADAARAAGGVGVLLERFAQPGPAILTGTQMVAKGHDFPDVELAAVIDADTALAIPDFRAEERAFSMVAQLAGRAGRTPATSEHARVIVQTWDTEQEHLAFAVAHDVAGFMARELERRRELRYPPFTRIVRVLVSARRESDAMAWASAAAEGMSRLEAGPVLGPAPLLRIGGFDRAQVLTKTNHVAAVAAAFRAYITQTERERARIDVRMLLDVDPQALV